MYKKIILSISISIIVINNSTAMNLGTKKNDISGYQLKTVPFVYISQIGGMAGGFTALSNSYYIGNDNLVQVSKEETNGIMHLLKTGHSDISAIFDYLSKNFKLLQLKRKSAKDGQHVELPEYYPPQTLLCFSVNKHNDVICNYFEKNEITSSVRDFLNKVQKLIDRSKFSFSESGLYVRAQRILDSERRFIKPDLELQHLDLVVNKNLVSILEREMSLVRVGRESDAFVLSKTISLLPDKPLYLQIGKDVYLLIAYRYKG